MSKLVGGVTDDDAARVGLSADERAALEQDDEDIEHEASRPSKSEVEAIEHELKKDDKDDGADPEAEAKAAEEAEKKREADERAKAEAAEKAATDKRKQELDAMSAEDRAKAEAEDRAKAEAAASKAKDEEQRKASAGTAEDEPAFTPAYNAPAVEDYDGKVKTLDTRLADAEAKFKSSEMSFDEFRKTEREIQTERRKLDDAKLKHELSQEYNDQQASARWQHECNAFFKSSRDSGIDYKDPKNKGLWAALDVEVKELAKDEKHADKSGAWFLQEADRRVREQFKLERREAPKSKDVAVREATKDRQRAAPKPSLGSLPAASDAEDTKDASEFAHLEKLEGMELEAALAGMSKTDADRYLAGK